MKPYLPRKIVSYQIFATGEELKACLFIEEITPERVISISNSAGCIYVWYWTYETGDE